MHEPPRSEIFDDVYFSALGGFEETQHVFIQGNKLPANWQGRKHFTICETGFGTGLNFLSAWALFEETADSDAVLDYISFEKFPLSSGEIEKYLAPWKHILGSRIDYLCREYPLRIPGFHRIVLSPRIILTLAFDDVNEALPELDARVDCWFLDGFTPAKNPDMWSDLLFYHMEKLSAPAASFATFTSAGSVKRGLAEAGFEVEKIKGFAHKRDMLRGRYKGQGKPAKKSSKNISILGGGLAGTACAHVLEQYGLSPVLYEREKVLAGGASGSPSGIYNPRISALRSAESDFYASAFAQAYRQFLKFDDVGFMPFGALHLINDEDKQKRFSKTLKNWKWPDNLLQALGAQETNDVAGIHIDKPALYLPLSGSASPEKLCRSYGQNIEVCFDNAPDIETLDTDAVVLANGISARSLYPHLSLDPVRGQISFCRENEVSGKLKTALCYGGYISPSVDGTHIVGSTFQKWVENTDILEDDHGVNIEKLTEAVPLLNGFEIQGGWAGIRVATKDRFPLVGQCDWNIYTSLAHGSHGMLTTLMGGHLLADMLRGGPLCLPKRTVNTLSPQRFK